jgi:hypothetical protein
LLSSGWDFLGGILNLVDVLANVIIVTTIILFSGIKVKFRSFEKWYLIVALLIILFWLLTDNPFKANLLIQTLILVGYFPTIQKLVVEKKNTEPLWAWVIVYSAGLLALYPAINSGSILPMIYVGRTLIMQAVIIGLGLFYGYRNKRLSDGGI